MKHLLRFILIIFVLTWTDISAADGVACPKEVLESGGICLTKDQRDKLSEAVLELQDIHGSKAEIELQEPIVIIRDWEDRIFVNGGEKKPIELKLRVGKHIDRDLEVQLPIQVFYREEPPDPMFRLRIRAQLGILVPQLIKTVGDRNDLEPFWDAGVGWDFFHIQNLSLNVAAYTGIRSAGLGAGLDLTKNFGIYAGYGIMYDGWDHTLLTSVYFAFN